MQYSDRIQVDWMFRFSDGSNCLCDADWMGARIRLGSVLESWLRDWMFARVATARMLYAVWMASFSRLCD